MITLLWNLAVAPAAALMLPKCHNNWKTVNPDLSPSIVYEVWRWDDLCGVETIPMSPEKKSRVNRDKTGGPVCQHDVDGCIMYLINMYTVFSCDQAALQMVFSVRLSVRLSHLFDYVPIIVSSLNFQELLPMTKVRSMQKVKVRGQRSRSQRSQPNLTVSGL